MRSSKRHSGAETRAAYNGASDLPGGVARHASLGALCRGRPGRHLHTKWCTASSTAPQAIVAMVCTMRMRCTHATLLRTVLAFVIVCLPASSCSFVKFFSCFSATYSQQPHKALQRLQAEPTEPSVCCAVVWHIWPGQHTPTGASASEQCRTAAWLGSAWLGLAALLYGAA